MRQETRNDGEGKETGRGWEMTNSGCMK